MKIFDCSYNRNHAHRPESLGPKENDIVSGLKQYSSDLNIEFVDDIKKSDLFFTNTCYTNEIVSYCNKNKIPLIKRMDGIYWRNDLIARNEKLNLSATQSDAVIFISEYSKNAYHSLYDEKLKEEYVVLNNVDERVFYEIPSKKEFVWLASATNWNRKEKRFEDIIKFADFINDYNEKLLLIGASNVIHKNVINAGYISNYKLLNKVISKSSAMINLSYQDPAPKAVLQSISCNKPVLYADSGGVSELVRDFGIPIKDDNEIKFRKENADLNFDCVKEAYYKFKEQKSFKRAKKPYIETLIDYVKIFHLCLDTKK